MLIVLRFILAHTKRGLLGYSVVEPLIMVEMMVE